MYFNITVVKKIICMLIKLLKFIYEFRKGKLIVDHIFALRQIMTKHCEFNKELYLMFIDYKTCDSINKKELSRILEVLDVLKKYAHWIK